MKPNLRAILQVLSMRGPLTHRDLVRHLRRDGKEVSDDLMRLQAGGDVAQVGKSGPWRLTDAGAETMRAVDLPAAPKLPKAAKLAAPLDPALEVLAIAEEVLAARQQRDQGIAAADAEVLAKQAVVEEAMAILDSAQADLEAVRKRRSKLVADFDARLDRAMSKLRDRAGSSAL